MLDVIRGRAGGIVVTEWIPGRSLAAAVAEPDPDSAVGAVPVAGDVEPLVRLVQRRRERVRGKASPVDLDTVASEVTGTGSWTRDQVVVVARVKAATTRRMQKRRGTMLTATITDGTTDIDITFFDARAHEHKLLPGARALFAGQVSEYRGRLQLAHPGYTILPEELSEAELAQRGPIPEYPYVKKLHNWTLAECVRLVLDHLDDLPDPLPDEVRAAHDLPDLTTTYRWLHRPDDLHQVERARERLRMEEALVLQTVLGRRRRARERETTRRRAAGSHGLLAAFDARLPFELTAGQREIGEVLMDRYRPDAELVISDLPPVLSAHVGLGTKAAVIEGPTSRPVWHGGRAAQPHP